MQDDLSVCRLVEARMWEAGIWSGDSRTHRVSPRPFYLTPDQLSLLQRLGPALHGFYKAVNRLYNLREEPWVAQYLDQGKSDETIRHTRMNYHKQAIPQVIRPDILITKDGLTITELDSVPGGIGHMDCLSSAYESLGMDLIGSPRGMRDGFADVIRGGVLPEDGLYAVVVSDESADYLPEMLYLCAQLRDIGIPAYAVHPKDVLFTDDALYLELDGKRLAIRAVYRFFELFDLLNIPKSELLSYAARKRMARVTPPYKHIHEEKMLLALLRHPRLAGFWVSELGHEHFDLLHQVFAETWIMDPRPVPPHAEVAGFRWKDKPIRDWREITNGTQKDRRLVLKPSGYSPLAWGSRGVKIGHDMAQEEWAAAVNESLDTFYTTPYVLQAFRETAVVGIDYADDSGGDIRRMQSRVRLCVYYFAAEEGVRLGGVLATACPKDKKIIHGMVDAVMCPCAVSAIPS